MAAILELREISCTLGGRRVLRGVALSVEAGETVMLLGRSGSGKTTLLKAVNGLDPARFGRDPLRRLARRQQDAIRLRRRMGYVIQDAGLFPHWTVEANIGLVPRLENWATARIADRTRELLEAVGLPGRAARALSAATIGRTETTRGNRARTGGRSAAAAAG